MTINLLTPNQKSTNKYHTVNICPPGMGMLVIIDSRVENYQILASGVLPGAKVLMLKSDRDGVGQITRAIANYPVSSLHIVGHGSPGSLQLGNTNLNSSILAKYEAEFQRWGTAIGSGRILLYGCEVGAGDVGVGFVRKLYELSGVGVAAAVGRVGNAELGGSWELGVEFGAVGDGLAFEEEVLVSYGGVFADLTVNSTGDNQISEDGLVTLREAILAANSDTSTDLGETGDGADTIIFDPAVFGTPQTITLTPNPGVVYGGIIINDDLTIAGTGASNLTISGDNSLRVFNINSSTVTINSVTISNGSFASEGGGVLVETTATVTINNSTISDNFSQQGAGGIFNRGDLIVNDSTISTNETGTESINGTGGGIYNGSGTLTINNSTISGNIADIGAGIYNREGIPNDSAIITVNNSIISGNSSSGAGGGIFNSSGVVEINASSTISNNNADSGAGISNDNNAFLELNNSTITGNIATGSELGGGGIDNEGSATVTNSTISGNSSSAYGGGIDNDGTVTVINSTISGNNANDGGGVRNVGTAIVTNSTISGNLAEDYGGGIWNNNYILEVNNSTITQNIADHAQNEIGNGGGIANGGTANINNTIIAGNFDNSSTTVQPDVSGLNDTLAGAFNSNASNLIGDIIGSSGFDPSEVLPDTIDLAAVLDPNLADNGGSTLTHALVSSPTNPAVNGGNNANIPPNLEFDQRGEGFPRIIGEAVDIGAFEASQLVTNLGSISGVKFRDDNQNGIRDIEETGLGEFTIYLDANDNGVLDAGEPQTITDTFDGSFSFNNLAFGNYIVRELPQQGFLQTTPETVAVTLSSEQPNITNINIGNSFGFGGRKFNDLNGNAILDADEPGLANFTIYIDINDNQILDDGEPFAITDAEGNYRIFTANLDIPSQDYVVREVPQTSSQQTTANPIITISDGQIFGIEDTFNINFGNQQQLPQGNISGTKLNDTNNDGIGDTPAPNITIYLDANNNSIPDTNEIQTQTDINGFYQFDNINLAPNTYSIRDIPPVGFIQLEPAPTITIDPTDTTFNFSEINLTNIPDNIIFPGISITQTDGSTNVTEGLLIDTYQIVLDTIPTAPVSVAIAPDNQTDLGAGGGIPITRTFDNTNAQTPQIITVTAVDDDLAEGPHLSNITHNASSNDPSYNTPTVPFTVDGIPSNLIFANIIDNDTPAVSNQISTEAAEGGFTGLYSLVLTTQPTAPVTINFDTGDQIEPIAPIIFNQSNWNSERLITVTAIDDLDIEGNHIGTINHIAVSDDQDYDGINILEVTVDITDNDTATVAVDPTNTEVTEGGATDSYEIVLTTPPAAPVTINFDTGDQIEPIAPITFDQSNWNVGRIITVAATDDLIVEGNHIGTINHQALSDDSNYNSLEISPVTATITDNDTAAISIDPITTDASEAGVTGSYEIVLTTQPAAPVTIEFDTGEQIQSIAPITFDQSNWNIPQQISVIAIDDTIAENNHLGTISHQVTSGDENYSGIQASQVTVNITDNDIASVAIDPQMITATEDGIVGNYQIVLTTIPTADVTIQFNTDNQIEAIAPIVFTPQNSNIPQNITVAAVDDALVEGEHIGSITHQASSTDSNYNLIDISQVTVDITDNDIETGSVSGVKFQDDNQDGIQNPGEQGLAGFTIYLDVNNNNIFETDEPNAITTTDGSYTITNIPPGDYILREIQQAGFSQTTPNPNVTVITNQNTPNQNFGNAPPTNPGSISGAVFNDLNNSNFPNPTEGIAGITVFLDSNNNNILDSNETNTLTNSNGDYNFLNLQPNTYNIRAVAQPNFIPEVIPPVTLLASQNTTNINIRNNISPSSISGITFNDTNRNGFRDSGETALANVTVFLDSNENNILDPNEQATLTNEFGSYTFANLLPDTYIVRTISPQPDATLTTPEFPVTLSSGQNVNVDFGYSIPNPGILQFSAPTFSVTENTPTATVTITRTGGSDGVVSANINLSDGTASQNIDYGNSTPNPVFFANGQTQQTASIPIINDTLVEENETVNLSLTNITIGVTLGELATATLEIINDDITLPPQPPQLFVSRNFGFEEYRNFDPVSSIRVNTNAGNASLLFSTNTIALVSLPKGGQGRFSGAPGNNTVIAYDLPDAVSGVDAIVVDLRDVIDKVGEVDSGTVSFDYASPNISHNVQFLNESRQNIGEIVTLTPTMGEENDFSIFERENIQIPENTRFIAIGSESTEIGIDNLQLRLQPKSEIESSISDRFSSQIDPLIAGGNLNNLEEIDRGLILPAASFSDSELFGETTNVNGNNLIDNLPENIFSASDLNSNLPLLSSISEQIFT